MTARSRRADVVMTIVLLVTFAGGYLLSLAWPFRTALFPRLVSATGVLLALLYLGVLALNRHRATASTVDTGATAATVPGAPAAAARAAEVPAAERDGDVDASHSVEYVFASAGRRAWTGALAWIGGFFVALWLAGAALTVPVFALLYLRIAGGTSWRAAAVYAAVAGVVVVVILGRLLSVPMPAGAL